MTIRDSKSAELPSVEEKRANLPGFPEQLHGDPRRQAVPSFQGDAYQAWWSIDAWLRLSGADEVIYLEGAEDLDYLKNDNATTVQVRCNKAPISLGTAKAIEALENFWTLRYKEAYRRIDFHYLTSSSVAQEKDGNFGDVKGIEAWRAAQTNPDFASKIRDYLVAKLNSSSPLKIFLSSATPQEVQDCLIKRFHWITDQPDLEAVKQSVKDRITVLLSEQRRSLTHIQNVQKYLESRFWEILLEPSSDRRILTRGELLRQFVAATTTYLPVDIQNLPELLRIKQPGLDLLNLLRLKLPTPPEPLLPRPELTRRLEALVSYRKVVLITGTVHKGKTTLAQLVCSRLCPEAWWINLTGREINEVDNVLLALAGEIEHGRCPSLIVIDDLDISPAAHRIYRNTLALVFHRARSAGRGILITAQGGSSNSAVVSDFEDVERIDVPELTSAEIECLCIEHGCTEEHATVWGVLLAAGTSGHPKLVQVRLAELKARDWPNPGIADATTQSAAVTSVHQQARQLLSDTVTGAEAEFVYLVSECIIPLHRSIAIRLAESVEGLKNGGDVLDKLSGKWIERLDGELFRTTQLLKGVTVDVWSPEKRKLAHIRLHDAFLTKQPHSPSEAAELLFHAFIGGEPRRLARTALCLQFINNLDAKVEVERQLLWLPYVALETGQSISDDPMAGAILRGFQFRVALTLDSDSLPQICARWADDIERIQNDEARAVHKTMMYLSIGFAENLKVPLKPRLEAISGITELPDESINAHLDLGDQFFKLVNREDGLPSNGTTTQAILLCAIRCVNGVTSLGELLQWLDNLASVEIREQFDAMLQWPLVQNLGAFVHGAWAAAHAQTVEWAPWLEILERVDDYAKRRGSLRFGQEAAKARAIILTEYLARSADALRVLEDAEISFGTSPVLMEQRANVLFQEQNDGPMLEIWHKLTSEPSSRITLDPFAYRRAGMCAARLKQWKNAYQIFHEGAESIKPGEYQLTKFGLRVDGALALSCGGDQAAAAKSLADAIMLLPTEASDDGNDQWEAVQRVAVAVCKTIENRLWNQSEYDQKTEPGYASSPDLRVSKVEPGQAARSELTRVQILHLVSTITRDPMEYAQELESLAGSRFFTVRWIANEALLAQAYSTGAGSGFIESLLAFDKATTDFSNKKQQGLTLFDPDDGPNDNLPMAPDRWFGLICAGIACAGPNLLSNLDIWLKSSVQILGEEAPLTSIIQYFIKGATLPDELLQSAIIDTSSPTPLRCGAAAQLLRKQQTADSTLQIQAFITSGLFCDVCFARQALFNRHVARCFTEVWRMHAQNRFQFYSPSTSVPALLTVLDEVEHGSGTLKSVLVAAASALNKPLGEFMARVF